MKQHQGANIPLTHIIIYLCAMSINGFDGTVVVPVLPLMAATFKVTPADLSGVEWAFLIASAAVLPLAGWLGARLGAARVFRIFLAGLGIGLLLSGIANSVWMLLAGRIIQGVSSGVLVPVGLAMMYRNATGADRLRISRLTLIPLTIAPMLGPVLGGIMAQHMGWRSIFTLLAAFSMGVFLAACFCMKPEAPDQTATALKIDRVGLVLVLISTAGLALLPVAIANATSRASSPLTYLALTVLTLLAGALMFYSWKRAQKRPYPALAVGAFTSRMFRSATVSVGISFAALTGFFFCSGSSRSAWDRYADNRPDDVPRNSGIARWRAAHDSLKEVSRHPQTYDFGLCRCGTHHRNYCPPTPPWPGVCPSHVLF
ncbi:hypothetical protein A7979_04990 [Rothia nasimurium]|uniref:Major facilitator superfamily (MFS) profile domain-containing protein n=1 Tax=Rothia nasimurium TaxID=85336 RepID=A0A1Y1RN08_9MICC|nr:hypothetical protein A7979_04990 [Rothia nasimurium]